MIFCLIVAILYITILATKSGNFFINITILGPFLSLNYFIHFFTEFYLFICSGISCSKFWHLEHARRNMLDMAMQCWQVHWEGSWIACLILFIFIYGEGSCLFLSMELPFHRCLGLAVQHCSNCFRYNYFDIDMVAQWVGAIPQLSPAMTSELGGKSVLAMLGLFQ